MKKTRIISGVVLFSVLLLILIIGNTTIVNITASIVGILAISEYFNAFKNKDRIDRIIGLVMAISIAFLDIIPKEALPLMAPIIIVALFTKLIVTNMKTSIVNMMISAFGILYVLGFLMFIPLLYGAENGKFLIWYIAIASWGTDTFAYFIGSKFGKHKLTEISPKKSIEGSVGGIVGAVLLAVIYTLCINKFANLSISILPILGITILLSVLSQIGDLAASSIKRFVKIKDYGNLIPGHGGMLDRIDSIIFIAPFAYYLLTLI